jgi:hypothetical protein
MSSIQESRTSGSFNRDGCDSAEGTGHQINTHVVDFVPVLKPDAFYGTITRINIDLWECRERTKEGLQELAARVAKAFRSGPEWTNK